MLYHKLHWGTTGGAEFLLGGAPPWPPPLNRPCIKLLTLLLNWTLKKSQTAHKSIFGD